MFDLVKIQKLQNLVDIPSNCGEQFITVYLNLGDCESGYISYGFKWKMEMGERYFYSLDEAINILTKLREMANVSI